MRIVIDYRPALRARTGVGEHIHQVTHALAHMGTDQLTAFSSSWKDRVPPQVSADLPSVQIVDRRIPVRALNFAWHRLRWPPIEALTGGEYDVAHSPHPLLLPSRSAAHVVTIHDLHFLTHADRTSAEIRRDYPALVRAHAHLADRIIVVSRFVAGEVQRLLDIPADRISVCANGAPEWTGPVATTNAGGYVLFVGTIEPRKNVAGLLAAYARLRARRPDAPRLVIAGAVEPGSADALASMHQSLLAGHVEYRGYVTSGDREALFKGAQIFVLPSFDEGFGIPALEAMSAGVPVVVSNRGALPEVVGDAGMFIDPDDVESVTAALDRMLGDADLRATCIHRGLERARNFSWTQTARDVRRAYEDALLARRHRSPVIAGAQSSAHSRNAHRH
ncbi:MAG TPA: glycosyltransferase family 1 protein [Vicinamibacterales bacterium]|nr:glycosyltransferase family 1 protein [Vicinamibacterales bacterium]